MLFIGSIFFLRVTNQPGRWLNTGLDTRIADPLWFLDQSPVLFAQSCLSLDQSFSSPASKQDQDLFEVSRIGELGNDVPICGRIVVCANSDQACPIFP